MKYGKKLGVETPPRRRIDRGRKVTIEIAAKSRLPRFFAIDSINFHIFHTSSRGLLKTLKDHR